MLLSGLNVHVKRNALSTGVVAGLVWRALAATSHGSPKVRAAGAQKWWR